MNKERKRKRTQENWGLLKCEDFNFGLIESYFENKDKSKSFQTISNRTISDIDLQELFMYIDRTNSKIGQQYLYDKLLTIEKNNNFDKQEKLIEFYQKNEQARIETQLHLSKLNKREAYYVPSLFQKDFIKRPRWFWIIPLLSLSMVVLLILTFVYPVIFPFLIAILITNLILHYKNKKNIYMYMDSVPQLFLLFKTAKKLLKDHYEEPVHKSLKSLEKHKDIMSIFSIESKTDSDVAVVLWTFLEYIKILFLIEPLLVFRVLKKLDNKRGDIRTLYEYIGRVDTAISIASLRSSLPFYCQPKESQEESLLSFEDIYHPLIEKCIANTLHTTQKSILLTGSNMSGKTTFIRTVAVNVLCAQTINTCFAKVFRLKPIQLFSAIRITDDMMDDKSYYFEEVLTVKQMIEESRKEENKLFLLDEIFKGTNTVERISAGKAVLSYIGRGNNLVFVSTHDIELSELLKESYELYHFTEIVENESIHFDYKLKRGSLTTRNAIRILELNNYPKEVIDEAQSLAKSGKIV